MLKGETDITSEYAASAFVWTRDTGNAAADATWNAAHNGVKTFTMNAADLTENVKLTCTLTGTSPDYGTVYVDENMNLIHAPAEADANDTLHLENGILSVETLVNEYELNENVLSIVRNRLNGSVTAEAWVYTAVPEKLVEFEYDASSVRTQKRVTIHRNTIVTDYGYVGKRLRNFSRGHDHLLYRYDRFGMPIIIVFNGVAYTVIRNGYGDVVGLYDTSGTEVVRYTYNVWGECINIDGEMAETLGRLNEIRYRSYAQDAELKLYNLHNRMYDPTTHRFINMDKVLGRFATLNMHAPYTYCQNHPIQRFDGNGLECQQCEDGVATECSVFTMTSEQMEQFMGILDEIYQLKAPGKPIDEVAENLISDGVMTAMGKAFPKVLAMTDVYNSVVEPFVAYAEESGQYFTNRMARVIAANMSYDHVDIVCFYGTHSIELGMVFWEDRQIIYEEFIEAPRKTTAAIDDQLALLATPSHGHPKCKQNAQEYYHSSQNSFFRHLASIIDTELKKLVEFLGKAG